MLVAQVKLRDASIQVVTARKLVGRPCAATCIRPSRHTTPGGSLDRARCDRESPPGGPLGRRGENFPQIFFPLQPAELEPNEAMTIVMCLSGRIPALGERLREAAQSIGPRVLVERVRTAAFVPAMRASRVDPVATLRAD